MDRMKKCYKEMKKICEEMEKNSKEGVRTKLNTRKEFSEYYEEFLRINEELVTEETCVPSEDKIIDQSEKIEKIKVEEIAELKGEGEEDNISNQSEKIKKIEDDSKIEGTEKDVEKITEEITEVLEEESNKKIDTAIEDTNENVADIKGDAKKIKQGQCKTSQLSNIGWSSGGFVIFGQMKTKISISVVRNYRVYPMKYFAYMKEMKEKLTDNFREDVDVQGVVKEYDSQTLIEYIHGTDAERKENDENNDIFGRSYENQGGCKLKKHQGRGVDDFNPDRNPAVIYDIMCKNIMEHCSNLFNDTHV